MQVIIYATRQGFMHPPSEWPMRYYAKPVPTDAVKAILAHTGWDDCNYAETANAVFEPLNRIYVRSLESAKKIALIIQEDLGIANLLDNEEIPLFGISVKESGMQVSRLDETGAWIG